MSWTAWGKKNYELHFAHIQCEVFIRHSGVDAKKKVVSMSAALQSENGSWRQRLKWGRRQHISGIWNHRTGGPHVRHALGKQLSVASSFPCFAALRMTSKPCPLGWVLGRRLHIESFTCVILVLDLCHSHTSCVISSHDILCHVVTGELSMVEIAHSGRETMSHAWFCAWEEIRPTWWDFCGHLLSDATIPHPAVLQYLSVQVIPSYWWEITMIFILICSTGITFFSSPSSDKMAHIEEWLRQSIDSVF